MTRDQDFSPKTAWVSLRSTPPPPQNSVLLGNLRVSSPVVETPVAFATWQERRSGNPANSKKPGEWIGGKRGRKVKQLLISVKRKVRDGQSRLASPFNLEHCSCSHMLRLVTRTVFQLGSRRGSRWRRARNFACRAYGSRGTGCRPVGRRISAQADRVTPRVASVRRIVGPVGAGIPRAGLKSSWGGN